MVIQSLNHSIVQSSIQSSNHPIIDPPNQPPNRPAHLTARHPTPSPLNLIERGQSLQARQRQLRIDFRPHVAEGVLVPLALEKPQIPRQADESVVRGQDAGPIAAFLLLAQMSERGVEAGDQVELGGVGMGVRAGVGGRWWCVGEEGRVEVLGFG